MKIEVSMLQGMKLKASFGEYEVISDQSVNLGGNEEFPQPYDYFLASLPLCAAFYIRRFCQQRDISTDGIKIVQNDETIGDDKYKKKMMVSVSLPETFPAKYRKAVIAAANGCTVKKVIQAMPEFELELV